MADSVLSDLADDVRRIGLAAGLDAVGIAPAEPFAETRRHLEKRRAAGLHGGMQFTYRNPARSTDPDRTVAGARCLVVGARRYQRARPAPGPQPEDAGPAEAGPDEAGPVRSDGADHGPGRDHEPVRRGRPAGLVARYASTDHYGPLRLALRAVADRLTADGWRARALADDNALVDREAAYRAALGWYGKNTNLLLPGRGSWFVLGAVVTDAPLPAAAQPLADGCGSCRRCLPACPTGALVGPGVLDARRCLAWLVQAPGVFPAEHRVALGGRLYGCDDCQEVCPENVAADRRHPPAPADGADQPAVDLLGLLGTDDDGLLRRHGRWYIAARQPRHLRRNALIAMANVAAPDDPEVRSALSRALADPDALIRAHAVWAAARLGHHELLGRLADDPSPLVRAEMAAAPLVPVR